MVMNPYDNGFILGARFDLAIGDMNAEPKSAKDFVPDKPTVATQWSGGAYKPMVNDNHFERNGDLVRVNGAMAHCRAYSVDNLWRAIKELVCVLNKRAYITHQAGYEGVDGRVQTAYGSISMSLGACFSAYGGGTPGTGPMKFMLSGDKKDQDKLNDLVRNLHITIGLPFCLLDRRTVAEQHRRENGPGTPRCYEQKPTVFYYNGCNNYFAFHPALTHMVMGAARMAMFMSCNNLSDKILSQAECSTASIEQMVRESNYKEVEKLWKNIRGRFEQIGHRQDDNPFSLQLCTFIDFLQKVGFGALGPRLYNNWYLNRKKKNYVGHFADLESWENDAKNIIAKHPAYKEFMECQKTAKSS